MIRSLPEPELRWGSWAAFPFGGHVAANCDHQAKDFNGEAAQNEGGTRSRSWEQHQRGDGEKETRWHN
jgi:hypothetical protein